MDWPIVTLLLGPLVPITVALIKLLPSRGSMDGEKFGDGLRMEVAVLKTRVVR